MAMNYDRMRKHELVALLAQVRNEKGRAPGDIVSRLRRLPIDYGQEHVILVSLDTKLHVLGMKVLFKGGIECSVVDIRVLLRGALMVGKSTGFILAHNHPSGECTPSREDMALARRLKDACDIIGLQLVDMLIFSECSHSSMKEAGYI
jgi:DNA repair protein RadC